MNKKNLVCLFLLLFTLFLSLKNVFADDLILTGELSGTYLSNENIYTQDDCTVEVGGSATFYAVNTITLNPGFHAKLGSTFEASIGTGSSGPLSFSVNSSTGEVTGIAYDPDNANARISLYPYVDGGSGTGGGTFLGYVDLPVGSTEFSFALPVTYADGQHHTLYLYARDIDNGHLIASACVGFTWESSLIFFVNSSTGEVTGTAYDPDNANARISIYPYVDGGSGTGGGTFLGYVDLPVGSTEFSFDLPVTYCDGQYHTLYLYARDIDGGHLISSSWVGFIWAVASSGPPSISLSVDNLTGLASGTASDPDRPGQSVTIRFFMDGDLYSGPEVGQTSTNGSTTQYSYQLDTLYQDGQTHTLYAYAIDDDIHHTEITASFNWEPGTVWVCITASAGPGGTITPIGNQIVQQGSSLIFTITPDNGYVIEDVLVDDQSVGPVSSYTFIDVTSDHTIHATFAEGLSGDEDSDGDNVSDYIEGILGTDPNDENDFPAPGAYYEYDELGRIERIIRIK